ncbi:MAG: hypothetical protein B7Y83_01165 [Flavobacteriales bacterium 32-34-25]|nr:MAG: hypothetical protein B7Y83_01165 [Flavobacteriales bacterium 32-34-25]
MKEIALLITSFNRKLKTLQCLESLFSQKGINSSFKLTIFLVDDGSTDGTFEAVSGRFPSVTIIKGTGDLFWNRGMHLAWKTALQSSISFDYFIWLNDDVVLYDDAVSHILDCADQSKSRAIVCGILETQKFSSTISYGGGNKINGRYHANLPSAKLQSCTIINGNFVLIPNSVFQVVGTIDAVFPHSLGDHDYALRAIKLGFKCYTSKKFIGYCELNPTNPKWCLPEVKLKDRIRSLYSPLGNSHPYYYFIYEQRHFGLFTAVKHFISIHLRLLMPQLWKQ